MSPARVLLLGDSHLARLGRSVPTLGPGVANRARGGAFSRDLAGQLAGFAAAGPGLAGLEAAVVSVGTNDAAPWKPVPLSEGVACLASVVAALPCPVVLLAPPGVDEPRLVRAEDRTNERVAEHRDAFASVVLRAGGRVVDSPALLAPLGPLAFLDDGVHLTPAAYGLVLPEVADAIAAVVAAAVALTSSDGVRRS